MNLNDEEKFKEFYGEANKQMPNLISDGRVPLSVAGLMRRRLKVLNRSSEVRESWWDNYFDTGDGAVRHSDGRLKIVHDAKYLRQLDPQTRLVGGAVPFSDGEYESLIGREFSKADVKKYCNKSLTREEVVKNPVWLQLAGDDKKLLKEYVFSVFAQVKKRFNYDGKMLGIYHSTVPNEGAAGRLWFMCRLDDFIGDSRASGNLHLDDDLGRLVGVSVEGKRNEQSSNAKCEPDN